MNKLTMYLISALAGLGLFLGGIALGDALGDDQPAAAARPATVEIAAATPADPDSGPDGPDTIDWPRPSPRQLPAHLVVPNNVAPSAEATGDAPPADAGGYTIAVESPARSGDVDEAPDPDAFGPGGADPDGPDSDDTVDRPPYRPPTLPGGLDEHGAGEPDPDAPFVVAEGVEELSVEDLFGPDAPGDAPGPGVPEDPPFRDPCADLSDDTDEEGAGCPDGVGGTIVLVGGGDGPPAPLSIMRQFYTSIGVPLELRCPNLGTSLDGVYRPLFASNNPADFTIRYWPSTRRDDVREVTYRSSDAELDRWIDKRMAAEPTWADPHSGVHNCPEFELPDPFPTNGHFTFEIDGVDDFGSRASVVVYATLARPEAVLGRPPVTFTPRPGVVDRPMGILSVPYDPSREVVYVTAIPRDGPRGSERTCSDIEGDVLDGRLTIDPSIGRIGSALMARAPGSPAFDPIYSRAVTAEVWGVEGSRHLLCSWVTTPPARSFDRPTVVQRSSIMVRAPRHLRVRVSVGGGHADQALDARSVWVTATNWLHGNRGTFPQSAVAARRAFMLDAPELMVDSGGAPVPGSTILEVRGPTGSTQLVEVPTATRCLELGFMGMCPRPEVRQYDVPIPGRVVGRGMCGSGFGGCDPPTEETFVGNLRLVVERYAGPGGRPDGTPADGWVVEAARAFGPGAARTRPDTPQIDSTASYLRAVPAPPGGRPGVAMNLVFDRPVRLRAVPRNNFEAPCVEPETYLVDELRSTHTHRWPELCWKGTYSLALLAIDADGNELDMLPFGEDRPGPGHPGFGYVELPGVPIAEFTIDVSIDRLGDGMRPQSLDVSVGGVSVGTLIAPGHPPRCRTTAVPSSSYTSTVRNDGGRPITLGDSMVLHLRVSGTGDGIGCGLDERFVRIDLTNQLWLDDLLARPLTLRYDEPDGEITVTIRDVTPR